MKQILSLALLALGSATVVVGGARSQCSLVLTPVSPPSAISHCTAMTVWDRDGAGPLPPALVVAYQVPAPPQQGRQAIVAYDEASAQWTFLVSNVGGRVNTLVPLSNGRLVAAGNFSSLDGVPATDLARFDGTTWSQIGSIQAQAELHAVLELPNGDLLVGGEFQAIGPHPTLPATGLAAWNGTQWYSLGLPPSLGGTPTIRTLLLRPNGDLVVGGSWGGGWGIPREYIARFDGSQWHPFGPGFDAMVYDLGTLPNGDLCALGYFQFAGPLRVNGIARWDGSAWRAFGAGLQNSVGPGLGYRGLLLPDGDLLVSGMFSVAGNTPAAGLARWNGSSWQAPLPGQWGGGEMAWLHSGKIAMSTGGPTFLSFVQTSCPARVTAVASGCNGPGAAMTAFGTGLPWAGATFHSHTDGVAANGLAFAAYGFQSPAQPLTALHPAGAPGCLLLSSAEVTWFAPAAAGRAASAISFPRATVFLGAQLHHQFLQIEFAAPGGLLRVAGSNGLRLEPGAF